MKKHRIQLDICMKKGLGVKRDYKEAIKWYKEAAEFGYPYAEYNACRNVL